MNRFELVAGRIFLVALMVSAAGLWLLLLAMLAMSLFSPSSLEGGCAQ